MAKRTFPFLRAVAVVAVANELVAVDVGVALSLALIVGGTG